MDITKLVAWLKSLTQKQVRGVAQAMQDVSFPTLMKIRSEANTNPTLNTVNALLEQYRKRKK